MVRVQLGPQRGCRAVSRRGRGQGPRLVDVLATGEGANPVGEYGSPSREREAAVAGADPAQPTSDRKSTRLNSSHPSISYAVFCLKKKNRRYTTQRTLLDGAH